MLTEHLDKVMKLDGYLIIFYNLKFSTNPARYALQSFLPEEPFLFKESFKKIHCITWNENISVLVSIIA